MRKNLITYLLVYGLVMLIIYNLPTSKIYSYIHNELTFTKQKIRSKSIDPIAIEDDAVIFRNESNLNNEGIGLETDDAYYLVNDMLLLEKRDKDYRVDSTFVVTSYKWSIGGVQIVGDWLFYKSNGIHRINLDGTQEELLYKGGVMDFYVTPEWIYFVDYKNGSHLFRMTINGEDLTCINAGRLRDLLYTGDAFYATVIEANNGDDAQIVKLDLDGKEVLVVADVYGHNLIKEDEYLYYRSSEDWFLWRTNLTTLVPELIIDHRMTYFAMDDDYIYYSTRDENSDAYDDIGLYRMDRQSKEIINLDNQIKRSTGIIQLLGQDVLIESDYVDQPFGLIRMDNDGGNPTFIPGRDS